MAEKLITKSFERLLDKGKHRGFITYEELGKSLGKRNTTNENIERAFLILVDEKIISQEYLNEGSLSTLVGGVSAALAIKVKSKFRQMKSATEWQQKLNYMGEMIVLNVYGSVMSAAVAGRNTSILNKIKSIGKK